MSLVASLNVGVSSLRSFSQGIQVISNNIANVSTVGYKSAHANYSDTFNNLLKPLVPNEKGIGAKIDPTQLGGGVQVQSVTATFTQGSVVATGTTSDLAIAGPGYFRVKDPVSGNDFVTRAGNFRFDANGYLVTQQGYRVQGTNNSHTNVSFDPATGSYDVKTAASNPVKVSGYLDSGGSGETKIQVSDPTGLAVGMVVYSANTPAAFTLSGDPAAASWVTATTQPTSTATGVATITGVDSQTWDRLQVGQPFTGPGIPAGSVIATLPVSGTVTVTVPMNTTITESKNSSYYYSSPAWNNAYAGALPGVTPQGLNTRATILGISGTTVTLSNTLSLQALSKSNVTPLTFVEPKKTTLNAKNLLQFGSTRVYTVEVPDTSGVTDGMVAKVVDPTNQKFSYAGVTVDRSSTTPRIMLDFSAFGDLAAGGNNPDPTVSHFPSVTDTNPFFNIEFETHNNVEGYKSASAVGDVRITFKEGDDNDFTFTDLNGAALNPTLVQRAQSNVPKVKSFTVGTDGSIMAQLSNGQTFVTGKVLLQDFTDPGALVREGDNLFSGMSLAGEKNSVKWGSLQAQQVSEVTAGRSGLGLIQGSALEQSNVDIGQEFATMITTQRSFQAGSRVITVADQMLEETVNLKR